MERVGNPHQFTTSLVSCHEIGPGILEVRMVRPAGFTFLPGQFVRFVVDNCPRDYTIISGPDAETIDFCIALIEGGRFSALIARATAGDRFQLSGPHGHFIFQESTRRSVFVATGTGVAPFVAFCRSGVTDAILLHGVHVSDQLIYRQLLESCLDAYIPCISSTFDRAGSLKDAFAGRVTTYLDTLLAPDIYNFYLCGQRIMIVEATALIDDRFDGSRLFIENFD